MNYGSTLNTLAVISVLSGAFLLGFEAFAFSLASLLALAWAYLADLWRDLRKREAEFDK